MNECTWISETPDSVAFWVHHMMNKYKDEMFFERGVQIISYEILPDGNNKIVFLEK